MLSKRFSWCSIILILLTACGDSEPSASTSTRTFCKLDRDICKKLPDEGWCNAQRDDLIRATWFNKHRPSNKTRYQLLKALAPYQTCLTVAAQIEPVNHKQRKTRRTETLLAVTNQISQLQLELSHKRDLFSLYYRWSQLHDEQAKRMFIARENNAAMQDPILLYGLASLYNKSAPQKSLALMRQALSLYSKKWPIPNYLLESITTEYMRLNRFDKAYIWSLVIYKVSGVSINTKQLIRYHHFSKEEIKKFAQRAEEIAESIKKRQFKP